jgi:hypothetical protein
MTINVTVTDFEREITKNLVFPKILISTGYFLKQKGGEGPAVRK